MTESLELEYWRRWTALSAKEQAINQRAAENVKYAEEKVHSLILSDSSRVVGAAMAQASFPTL